MANVWKDECRFCDDKVWSVNGDRFYHPSTGMIRCANTGGGSATPTTDDDSSDLVAYFAAQNARRNGGRDSLADRAAAYEEANKTFEVETAPLADWERELRNSKSAPAEDAEWLRRANPSIGVAVSDNAIRRAMAADPVDLPGFPRPEHGDRSTYTAELCCVCEKAPAAYRNYKDQPFCKPCADGVEDAKDAVQADTESPDTTYATLTLNLDNPTDRAFHELSNVIRSKRGDYAADGDEFSNFRDMAAMFGGFPWDAANVLEMCKLSRLKALTANGREPANESVLDSHRDKAAYALLAFAMLLAEGAAWAGTE